MMPRPQIAEPDVITRGLALAAAHQAFAATEPHTHDVWENGDHAQLTSDIMSGKVEGMSREGNISPAHIEDAKSLADQIFMKLLKKDFKDGSYYRTIIAHCNTAPPQHRPIENKPSGKQRKGAVAKSKGKAGKAGGGPDACACMIRARDMGLELTCLVQVRDSSTPCELAHGFPDQS